MKLELTDAQLRRIVDGAVKDAMNAHPEYFTPRGGRMAKNGIAKRVTGALQGFAREGEKSASTQSGGVG